MEFCLATRTLCDVRSNGFGKPGTSGSFLGRCRCHLLGERLGCASAWGTMGRFFSSHCFDESEFRCCLLSGELLAGVKDDPQDQPCEDYSMVCSAGAGCDV